MLQFKPSGDKKKFPFSEKKDTSRYDNIDFGEQPNQYSLRINHERNQINSQLLANYNQIKQLLKERKILLQKKADALLRKNKQRLDSIANARHQDLKNQAKILNDRTIMNLIEHAQDLNGSNNALRKIAQIKDISSYDSNQRSQGKIYWDTHKEIQKQMRRKAQIYTNYSRQLKAINQRQRGVFNQIQKYQSEMISQLTRARKDPDHIRRAEKCNEEIDRCKGMLRELKVEKDRMKRTIQDTIDDILDFNNKNEGILKRRYKQLTDMFAGTENLTEFDQFMNSLQIVIDNKQRDGRQEQFSLNNLKKLVRDYDLLLEQVQKYKEEEQQIFNHANEQFKQNIKKAVLEKAYFTGIPQNIRQQDLLKKCRHYRQLLADLSQDRPKIDASINKMNQMNSMLYPVKKAYATQDSRREQLKRELKKLCASHSEIERNAKRIRDFAFEMDAHSRKRQALQLQLNEYAEKGNLSEYKNKVRQLENLNKFIEESRDFANSGQVSNMEQNLVVEVEKLYEQYEDIVEQLEVNDQNVNLGTYLNKLQKRISLI